MMINSLWELFVKDVFPVPSTETLFNPYYINDPSVDLPHGSTIRKQNLYNYLNSFLETPPVLLIGEAPGPWGCRFSGIPFTSEKQLAENKLPFKGLPSSTFNPPMAERSASIFWGTMATYHPHFFIWNCIPLQPHPPEEPFTIRSPHRNELEGFNHILSKIVEIIQPKHIYSIGRKSEQAVKSLGLHPTYIRHPSHGGKRDFQNGIRAGLDVFLQ